MSLDKAQEIIYAGITKLKQIPSDIYTNNSDIANYEKFVAYLKMQYNVSVITDTNKPILTKDSALLVDRVFQNIYSPISPNTLYYRFDKLGKDDIGKVLVNALIHYTFAYNSTEKTNVFNLGQEEQRKAHAFGLDFGNVDKKPITTLKLVTFEQLVDNLFNYYSEINGSVSTDDLKENEYLLDTGFDLDDLSAKNRDLEMYRYAYLDFSNLDRKSVPVPIRSLSDLMRYTFALSALNRGVDYDSQSFPNKLKLKTRHQKIITSTFYDWASQHSIADVWADLAQHRSQWKLMFMLINKFSNKKIKVTWYNYANDAFDGSMTSPNSRIEDAIKESDTQVFSRLLSAYPSLTIRHLVDFNRKADSPTGFYPTPKQLKPIPTRIIVQVIQAVMLATPQYGAGFTKLGKIKGGIHLLDNVYLPNDKDGANRGTKLLGILSAELESRIPSVDRIEQIRMLTAERPKDEAYSLTFDMDGLTTNDDLITTPYLSSVLYPKTKYISPMIYWETPKDYDLSVDFYNDDFSEKKFVAYYNPIESFAQHSGDITSASKETPAVERVLVDRQKALAEGFRYMLVKVYGFNSDLSTGLKYGVATHETRPSELKLYAPDDIDNLSSLHSSNTQAILFVYDLQGNKMITIEKPLWGAHTLGSNSLGNTDQSIEMIKAVLAMEPLQIVGSPGILDRYASYYPETQKAIMDEMLK